MNRSAEKPIKRKRHRRGRIYRAVSAVIILAVVVISVSLFFRVDTIEIHGTSACRDDIIVQAAGIKPGDSMLFLNRFDAANGVVGVSPYVKAASIRKKLPSTIVINVTEAVPVASVRIGDSTWLLDSSGRLLEKQSSNIGTVAVIKGVSARSPSEGEIISLSETENVKRGYLLSLLELLEKYGLYGKITAIDMSNTTDVKFEYLDRYTVRLGQDDSLEDKIAILNGVVEQLGEYYSGMIDLSTAHEAHFIPG